MLKRKEEKGVIHSYCKLQDILGTPRQNSHAGFMDSNGTGKNKHFGIILEFLQIF